MIEEDTGQVSSRMGRVIRVAAGNGGFLADQEHPDWMPTQGVQGCEGRCRCKAIDTRLTNLTREGEHAHRDACAAANVSFISLSKRDASLSLTGTRAQRIKDSGYQMMGAGPCITTGVARGKGKGTTWGHGD